MNDDLRALTGAYALNALTAPEREQFEQHLHGCAECRTEVAGFQDAAAQLGSIEAAEPPAQLKERVLAEVSSTRQDRPPQEGRGPRHLNAGTRKWRRTTILTAAAAIVVLIAGVTAVVVQQRELTQARERSDQIAEVMSAPDAQLTRGEVSGGGTASVVWSADHDAATILLSELPPTAPERTYQLWLIDGEQASSAGTLDLHEPDRVQRVLHGVAGVDAIGLSIEPHGGSEQPTSDPLVALEL